MQPPHPYLRVIKPPRRCDLHADKLMSLDGPFIFEELKYLLLEPSRPVVLECSGLHVEGRRCDTEEHEVSPGR
jgi:hypothetical protein